MNEKNSQHMTSEAAPAQPEIEAVFRAKGIPFTRQRRLIWEYFAGATKAATIGDLTEALADVGIGQATVYRTINLLSELGLLARVQDRRGDICYTAPSIGHSHPLICGACRRIVRFDGDGDLDLLAAHLTGETGFAIYGHHLEVYGLCEDCQAGGTDA
jgi:Fe2+ or Zn2+ uptake regulation protein